MNYDFHQFLNVSSSTPKNDSRYRKNRTYIEHQSQLINLLNQIYLIVVFQSVRFVTKFTVFQRIELKLSAEKGTCIRCLQDAYLTSRLKYSQQQISRFFDVYQSTLSNIRKLKQKILHQENHICIREVTCQNICATTDSKEV